MCTFFLTIYAISELDYTNRKTTYSRYLTDLIPSVEAEIASLHNAIEAFAYPRYIDDLDQGTMKSKQERNDYYGMGEDYHDISFGGYII